MAFPCRGVETLIFSLFEPLGYQVEARRPALNERFPSWGGSRWSYVKNESKSGTLATTLPAGIIQTQKRDAWLTWRDSGVGVS